MSYRRRRFFTFHVYFVWFCYQNQRVSKGKKHIKNRKILKIASGGATGRGFFLVSDLPPAYLAMSAEHKLLYVRPYPILGKKCCFCRQKRHLVQKKCT